jgi:hypothetical protein
LIALLDAFRGVSIGHQVQVVPLAMSPRIDFSFPNDARELSSDSKLILITRYVERMPIEKSLGVHIALVNEHVHKGLSLEVARVAHRGEVPISIVKGLIEAEVDVLDLIVEVEPQEGIGNCHTINVL